MKNTYNLKYNVKVKRMTEM